MDKNSDLNLFSDKSFYSSIKQLKDQQKQFEAQERFTEAEEIESKIQKLKEKQKKKEIYNLKSRQRSERQSIDSIFKKELKNFNHKWDESLKNCLKKFESQQEELLRKQSELYNSEKESLEKNAPSYFKPSGQLLNIIKCKEKAVVSKKYKDAQKLADEIEVAIEYEKKAFLEQRQAKIDKQLMIFQKKLDKEVEVLQKKQEVEILELKKLKDLERENMEKKVENICRELENAQNIQVNIAKGLHTTAAGRQSPQRPISSSRSEFSTPQKFLTHKKSMRS